MEFLGTQCAAESARNLDFSGSDRFKIIWNLDLHPPFFLHLCYQTTTFCWDLKALTLTTLQVPVPVAQVLELGQTSKTCEELETYIRDVLSREHTEEKYDLLKHNCASAKRTVFFFFFFFQLVSNEKNTKALKQCKCNGERHLSKVRQSLRR